MHMDKCTNNVQCHNRLRIRAKSAVAPCATDNIVEPIESLSLFCIRFHHSACAAVNIFRAIFVGRCIFAHH